jgi:hypothetical protein
MTASEHVLILLSLVVSLALARLLSGIARLIHNRNVRWSWLHGAWMLLVFMLLIDFWISVWQLRLQESWNILLVFFWMTMATIQYLIAALVVPDKVADQGIHLAEFHEQNRSRYVGLFFVNLGFALAANLMLEGFSNANYINITAIVFLLAAGFARQRWLQWVGTGGMLAIFALYFALFMANIEQF